jgi:hypothetical protein
VVDSQGGCGTVDNGLKAQHLYLDPEETRLLGRSNTEMIGDVEAMVMSLISRANQQK